MGVLLISTRACFYELFISTKSGSSLFMAISIAVAVSFRSLDLFSSWAEDCTFLSSHVILSVYRYWNKTYKLWICKVCRCWYIFYNLKTNKKLFIVYSHLLKKKKANLWRILVNYRYCTRYRYPDGTNYFSYVFCPETFRVRKLCVR